MKLGRYKVRRPQIYAIIIEQKYAGNPSTTARTGC